MSTTRLEETWDRVSGLKLGFSLVFWLISSVTGGFIASIINGDDVSQSSLNKGYGYGAILGAIPFILYSLYIATIYYDLGESDTYTQLDDNDATLLRRFNSLCKQLCCFLAPSHDIQHQTIPTYNSFNEEVDNPENIVIAIGNGNNQPEASICSQLRKLYTNSKSFFSGSSTLDRDTTDNPTESSSSEDDDQQSQYLLAKQKAPNRN